VRYTNIVLLLLLLLLFCYSTTNVSALVVNRPGVLDRRVERRLRGRSATTADVWGSDR